MAQPTAGGRGTPRLPDRIAKAATHLGHRHGHSPAPAAATGAGSSEAASASWLPWLTGRAVVLAALALAKFEVSHLAIQNAKAVADAHAGLWSWDAGWYSDLAAHGYHAVGLQGLRFFPLLPVVASAIHHVTFLPVDAATALIANASALGATVVLYLLAKSEFGDAGRGPVGRLAAQPGAGGLRDGHGVLGPPAHPAGRVVLLPPASPALAVGRRGWASWPGRPARSAASWWYRPCARRSQGTAGHRLGPAVVPDRRPCWLRRPGC